MRVNHSSVVSRDAGDWQARALLQGYSLFVINVLLILWLLIITGIFTSASMICSGVHSLGEPFDHLVVVFHVCFWTPNCYKQPYYPHILIMKANISSTKTTFCRVWARSIDSPQTGPTAQGAKSNVTQVIVGASEYAGMEEPTPTDEDAQKRSSN